MSDTGKHLIEEVIPEAPTRQWVLSLPYAYRFLTSRNPDFLRKALAIFHRTLSRHYEKKARTLNLKVHFYTIYIDGVFYENNFANEVFFEIVPTHEEVVELNGTLKKTLNQTTRKI